jgi:hypothetical protein
MSTKDKVVDIAVKEAEVSFEESVWDELSRTDVTDHVDHLPKTGKRPAIPYLSWHKAWMLVCRKFPATQFEFGDTETQDDGTCEVEVRVSIQSTRGGDARFVLAKLAVMDNWFNAVANPDARAINDSRQRCLVKALAFAGLGLNLWDGSIVPVGKLDDPISIEQHSELTALIESTDTNVEKFLDWCEVDELTDLPFERFGSALGLLQAKARRMAKS